MTFQKFLYFAKKENKLLKGQSLNFKSDPFKLFFLLLLPRFCVPIKYKFKVPVHLYIYVFVF